MFLILDRLCKLFDKDNGIRNLNLKIAKGELVTILGPSGCGKTTTLNLIGGFLDADSGKILLDGQDITNVEPEKRPITTVFQSYALFPHMNVIENISYGLKYTTSLKKRERIELAMEYLDIVGLTGYENYHVGNLSGGQQQRVALARSLIINPKVLLLDEPFSNLDAKLRIKMREDLKRIQSNFKTTMIFVTHDQEEAISISDKIVVMDGGKIIQVGSPEEIYCTPCNEYIATFIGRSNILKFENINYLIRPEDIRLNLDKKGWIIKEKNFMGSYTTYILNSKDKNINVDVYGFDDRGFKVGESVGIDILHMNKI